MNAKQTLKGFTIIEVVLVLAIAGLIFLMVFVALPALQAGQRDTARKNDASAVAAAVNSFASANKGQYPPSDAKLAEYASNVSTNTTSTTIVAYPSGGTIAVSDGQVIVVKAAKCGATGTKGSNGSASQAVTSGTARQYAVITLLEAGNGSSFCQDS